jgi:protein involved in polysaccharide export with SLBB domain
MPMKFATLSRIAQALAALLLLGSLAACEDRATAGDGADPAPAHTEEYRLGPGDRVSIKVFGQQDISGEFEISSTGQISLPLVGQVNAVRHTLAELQELITKRLAEKYLVNPQVAIQVTNYRPFFILGQVNKPGSYPYQAGLTVRQAVAISGGYTRRAREEPVTVIRAGPDGREVRMSSFGDAPVLPGDSIDVGRRLF